MGESVFGPTGPRQRSRMAASRPGARMAAPGYQIPVLTTFDAPPGFVIDAVVGPCWGITVRARSIVGTACAGCQQIFGGEISALTTLATDSRNEAMHRLE